MKINNEDNLVFQNFIKTLLPKYSSIKKINSHVRKFLEVELMIRSECNQTCDYCYINNYRNNLYPERFSCNKEQILNNIQLLLNYFFKNEIYLLTVGLFAGDMFYDGLFYDLIQILYNYYNQICLICNDYKNDYKKINIPCNLDFCKNKDEIKKVQYWIDKFKKDLNVRIYFSWSTDGYYAINTREKQTKNNLEEYFQNAFEFCAKNDYGIHPMIAACNIESWIQNYDWLIEKQRKYFEPVTHKKELSFCALEVRNDDWTENKIQKYLQLLDHIFNYRWKECNYDLKTFAINTFVHDKDIREKYGFNAPISMDPILFYLIDFEGFLCEGVDNTCSLNKQLYINCYNLSIIPCHRTAYPHFRGGYFEIQNNEIVDIKASDGVNGYFNIILKNPSMGLKCNYCPIKLFCLKQCLGACYESNKDYNIPCETVCNLYKAKFLFLAKKYEEYNVFNYILNSSENEIFIPYIKEQILKILQIKEVLENE